MTDQDMANVRDIIKKHGEMMNVGLAAQVELAQIVVTLRQDVNRL